MGGGGTGGMITERAPRLPRRCKHPPPPTIDSNKIGGSCQKREKEILFSGKSFQKPIEASRKNPSDVHDNATRGAANMPMPQGCKTSETYVLQQSQALVRGQGQRGRPARLTAGIYAWGLSMLCVACKALVAKTAKLWRRCALEPNCPCARWPW